MTREQTPPAPWRFRPEVVAVRTPDRGAMIVVGGDGTTPVRLTGVSCALAEALREGVDAEAFFHILGRSYPASTRFQREDALRGFVKRLSACGLLEGTVPDAQAPGRRNARRLRFPNPDPLVARFARLLTILPGFVAWALTLALTLLAVTSVALSVRRHGLSWFLHDLTGWQWPAILFGLAVWLVLHETGHAILCRAQGCPVSGAGLLLRGLLWPSFYINTSAMHLFEGRVIRVVVPLAGPIVDLWTAGALGAVILASGASAAVAWAQALMLLVFFGFLANMSPFRVSDMTNIFLGFAVTGPDARQKRPAYPPKKAPLRYVHLGYVIFYLGVMIGLFSAEMWLSYRWVRGVMLAHGGV